MTAAELRQAIATAASTVEGITAHPYFVQSTNAGTAYVRLDRIEYPNRFGGIGFWDLVVLLPQDYAAAEKYLEVKVPALIEAINEHVVIDRVTPQQLQITGVGTIPAVFITTHKEAD